MGARELLANLADAGLSITAEGDRLLIRPGSKLTDDLRTAIRAEKPALLALLTGAAPALQSRPYWLATAEADHCHAHPWDDATCARFAARVGRFLRLGIDATDADDLAERLALRDQDADDRRLCIECRNCRPGLRCSASQRSGFGPDLGRDLATRLHRCPAFASTENAS